MICTNCGKTINDDATFCRYCGKDVIKDTDTVFCKKCGSPMKSDAEFCRNCGEKRVVKQNGSENIIGKTQQIGFAGNSNPKNQKNKKSKTPIFIAVAAVLVLFIGIKAISGLGGKTDSAPSEAVAVSSDRSLSKLVEVIDKAEKSCENYQEENKKITDSDIDSAGKYQKRKDLSESNKTELEELSQKASQISGLDAKVKGAVSSYFGTLISARTNTSDLCEFYAKFLAFDYEAPTMDQYDSPEEYFADLEDWYTNSKQILDGIENTEILEPVWTNYINNFELTPVIYNKAASGLGYSDFLRLRSSINLEKRRYSKETNLYEAILNVYKGESEFVKSQNQVANSLADEIRSYSKMDENARENYEFEYNRDGKIILNYDAVDTIYPTLYNTYDSFVIIKTGCISGNRDIVVEAEIPGFTQPFKQSYRLDSSYKAIHIKPPALTGDIDLTSAKSAQMVVSVYEKNGNELIDTQSFPVTIKSRNDFEWYSDDFGEATQDNILCFLTPDAEAIDTLRRNAITEISNMTGGKIQSLPGYQETGYGHYVGTYLQAAGIMRALYDMGVRYDMETFSISGSNQSIKLPTEVLTKKSGLCIETSLTVASALQSAGFHSFIILPTGHAQVAVEIWDDGGEGTGEYFLIETTCLSDSNNNNDVYVKYANGLLKENPDDLSTDWPISYLSSNEWIQYINDNDVYVIDCDDSRILGLTEFSN